MQCLNFVLDNNVGLFLKVQFFSPVNRMKPKLFGFFLSRMYDTLCSNVVSTEKKLPFGIIGDKV